MTISILIFLIISFLTLVLIIWMITLEVRLKKLFAGTKAKNLESLMVELGTIISNVEKRQEEVNKHLSNIDSRLDKSIRKIETKRFNPFADAGSNQSFAMALLNDEGNGVVLSSLYARDRMSIFAKPINNGKSDFELSNEEKEVLEKAK